VLPCWLAGWLADSCSLQGKVLIHVLPHKALDSALTEGFLDRAKKLREKKEGHHPPPVTTTSGLAQNVETKKLKMKDN
jgi:hypothetical protein